MKPKIKQLGSLLWKDEFRKWLQYKLTIKRKLTVQPLLSPRRNRQGKYACVPPEGNVTQSVDKKELAKMVSKHSPKVSRYNNWNQAFTLTEYNL